MLTLTQLLQRADMTCPHSEQEITGIAIDSRQVQPGNLFVALKGVNVDGTQFIPDAIDKGASVIVADSHVMIDGLPDEITLIPVNEPRLAVAKLAAAFYENQPQHIAAVTGTDGKTSTAYFLRQLWELMGYKAASIGTLGVIGHHNAILEPGTHTTPDPIQLHQWLAGMATEYSHLAMEASSHGLDQHRLDAVRVAAAAFTSFGRDHLDYHHSLDAYFDAKARLFKDVLTSGGTAVMNAEEKRIQPLIHIATKRGCRIIEYGKGAPHLNIRSITPLAHGQRAQLTLMGQDVTLETPLVGDFQIYNMLATLGLASAFEPEFDWLEMAALLPKLTGVPGRLQQVTAPDVDNAIFIDYAHTPMALASVLKTLRPHVAGELVVVFGCGGDRDKGKRAQMGRYAAQLADRAYVTDDNPRMEDAASIRNEVMAGCPQAAEIGDRREAIHTAIHGLKPDDVLLVAGKGHESHQLIGETKHPFNDAAVIGEFVRGV